MFAISRFSDVDDALLAQIELVAEHWRAKPGNVGVEVLRNIDDARLCALVSRWENVAAYRGALGGHETKLLITPVMLRAIDEPSAYLPSGESGHLV